MKINKYSLAVLFLVVLSSLGVLLWNQYRVVKVDIENKKQVIEFAIPGILSDLYDQLILNRELSRLTNAGSGTHSFQFSNASEPVDPLQLLLKTKLDETISLKYPNLNYTVDGFFSNEYGCMIHREHRPELPKAKAVILADYHMCFCMILDNTLDISMTYNNVEETALGQSGNILRTNFLLIIVILLAFWYTIYTIRKQKKLSDLKRDFVNNLTHEFKTPIFSISLAAQSLREKEEIQSSEKLTKFTNLISKETHRLQNQVDKILQMSLIDSGHLSLEKKKIDLHEAIRNAAECFRIILEERQGAIALNLNASRSQIVADETHLNNVLFNLIDNAQKYTDGKPEIEITTEDSVKNGVLLTIRDQGIGMDKTTQKYAFDQFYRAQKGDVHDVKGFGLGLSYVKKIIEFHKGTIHLSSMLGKGSEFRIYLPPGS